jgi:hypothetical protein
METFEINTGDQLSFSQGRLYVASSSRVVQTFGMDNALLLYAVPELAELLEEWYEEMLVYPGTLFLRLEDSTLEVCLFDGSNNKIGGRYTDHGVSRTPAIGLVPIRCNIGAETAYGVRVQDMDLYAPIQKIL